MHYTYYITHIIYDISSTLYDVSFTICVTPLKDSIYDIKHCMFVTSSLDMASHTVLWPHNNCLPSQPLCLTLHSVYFWHYTQCTNFMTRSEYMSSQPLYVWNHMHWIWHHIHYLWHHTTLFRMSNPLYITSPPLFVTSHPLYLCNHTHSISDITATLCMISHTVHMWHHIHYIYVIMSTMYDNTTQCVVDTTLGIYVTSFTLQMLSHPSNHSIYDVTSTSGMTSDPLYQTLHPLYFCQHNLSPDITPTFEWHHTQLLCDITCTI